VNVLFVIVTVVGRPCGSKSRRSFSNLFGNGSASAQSDILRRRLQLRHDPLQTACYLLDRIFQNQLIQRHQSKGGIVGIEPYPVTSRYFSD
jgi:hypothetical protein